ncbi:Uncharacterised protein [uncultured archaeon]|nr:Uncharacterised protein [uncultured archaeon]
MSAIGFLMKLIRILFKIGLVILIAATGVAAVPLLYLWHSNPPALLKGTSLILMSLAGYWLIFGFAFGLLKIAEKLQGGAIDVKKFLDFGLASKEEVIAKFGDEAGKAIIEERRLVFWKFGFLWAIFGAVVIIFLQHYFGILTGLEKFLRFYLGG